MFVWMGNLLVNTDRIAFVRVDGGGAEVAFDSSTLVQLDAETVRPVLDALAVDMTPDDPVPEELVLTEEQASELLEAYRHGFKWLTVDDVGFAHAHESVPSKAGGYWESAGARVRLKSLDNAPLFDAVSVFLTEDVLREAEVL